MRLRTILVSNGFVDAQSAGAAVMRETAIGFVRLMREAQKPINGRSYTYQGFEHGALEYRGTHSVAREMLIASVEDLIAEIGG